MLDVPILIRKGLTAPDADSIDIEVVRGHFFRLNLYTLANDGEVIAGALHYGTDRIALDLDHANQLADKVRASIDNCISGSIIHRSDHCQGGN